MEKTWPWHWRRGRHNWGSLSPLVGTVGISAVSSFCHLDCWVQFVIIRWEGDFYRGKNTAVATSNNCYLAGKSVRWFILVGWSGSQVGVVIWDYIVIAFLSTGFGAMPENANKDHPNGTPQLSSIASGLRSLIHLFKFLTRIWHWNLSVDERLPPRWRAALLAWWGLVYF